MLQKMRSVFVLLFIFGFSATVIGNEWANYYFPDELDSYWTYEDQDGEELTRYAIAPEEIEGETYRTFSYEPVLEDWTKYQYYFHPYFYQVSDDWVAFFVGDDIENTTRAVTEKHWNEAMVVMKQQLNNQLPPGVTIDLNVTYELDIEAQDYFYVLPTPATFNEEWEASRVDVEMDLQIDITSNVDGFPPTSQMITMFLTLVETGNVRGTETVETAAGTFEDCLIIEYKMDASIRTEPDLPEAKTMFQDVYKGALTTLWLAPNVGIVKMLQESESTDIVKTIELTNYEIKSTESESSESD
ncbi:hypothetical protein F4054_09595 [Candidatus Poribacteria bacterium]|nr:hypothetical protein [Candidatus Poribacteria bacterium]MYK22504.1 hypothetical protein [Candidatus Poribacteria bacterium]